MITLILMLAVVGFLTYLITNYIPMDDVIRKSIIVIVVVCMAIYVLRVIGIGDIPVPSLK